MGMLFMLHLNFESNESDIPATPKAYIFYPATPL